MAFRVLNGEIHLLLEVKAAEQSRFREACGFGGTYLFHQNLAECRKPGHTGDRTGVWGYEDTEGGVNSRSI